MGMKDAMGGQEAGAGAGVMEGMTIVEEEL